MPHWASLQAAQATWQLVLMRTAITLQALTTLLWGMRQCTATLRRLIVLPWVIKPDIILMAQVPSTLMLATGLVSVAQAQIVLTTVMFLLVINAGYSVANAGGTQTGIYNTFVGTSSGDVMTTGSKNTILGRFNGNTGGLDIRTSSNNIVLSDGDGNPRFHFDGTTWHTFTLASGAGTNALKFNSSTGAWTYDTSSARYKDNIRDSIYGLSHVMQMRSTQFEYKDTGRSDVGLIAEELDPIIPELVMKNKDGQPDSVSYDRMVSVLVKAIQELKAEFDAYKATHP
jgi:hypothetical protein